MEIAPAGSSMPSASSVHATTAIPMPPINPISRPHSGLVSATSVTPDSYPLPHEEAEMTAAFKLANGGMAVFNFDQTCQACHDVSNPGGVDNTSFCSNSACHGIGWEYAELDAPGLAEVLAAAAGIGQELVEPPEVLVGVRL